jgi:signal transduction histidine kinase
MHPEIWLRAAGFGTWLVSCLPSGLDVLRGEIGGLKAVLWLAAFLAFGLSFAAVCWVRARPRWLSLALVAAQSLAGLVMAWAGRDTLSAALLVVVAGQLLPLVSPRGAAAWVAAQTAALAAVLGIGFGPVLALAVATAFGGFQLFALAMAVMTARERTARDALAVANAELHAARALVAENSRAEERLRISRDLHDTIGHHLTALSLQLDVARRLTEGERASKHVEQSHAIARLLLADVRAVVSELRQPQVLDVGDAIQRLLPDHSPIAVHVHVASPLPLLDYDRAQAVVRCVQEAITNALRHSRATNLWIDVTSGSGVVHVRARDDGQGAASAAFGNGLRGMRERFEALSGRLDVDTRMGGGFEIAGTMPVAEVT